MLARTLPQLDTFVDVLRRLATECPDIPAFVFLKHDQADDVEIQSNLLETRIAGEIQRSSTAAFPYTWISGFANLPV